MTPKPLIVMALESESQGLLEAAGYEVLYCGVGKVNAARSLSWRLSERNVPMVLNLGTAGSPHHKRGSLVAPDRYVQRDMDATGLGFRFGQTPFDTLPDMLQCKAVFAGLPSGICASGDSFLQGKSPIPCDVIDMEAYALAKTCLILGVPFACVKYITDGADDDAHTHWEENLRHAAGEFVRVLMQPLLPHFP